MWRQAAAPWSPTLMAGLREIWAHKFRSALTMLGIILGVASLVAMSALVAGMEKGAKESLVAIGGLEKVRVESADLPPDQEHLADQAVGITLNDVFALQHNASLITRHSPEMRLSATASANGRTFRPWLCSGVWPSALDMFEHVIAHGRMFNELDDEMARNVCVIGTATRDELWGAPDQVGHEILPLGETIYLNGVPFTIIGMFQHYESEQERKLREFTAQQAAKTPAVSGGVARNRGFARRAPGSFAFRLKNATIYLPLNTVWMKFRSGINVTSYGPGFQPVGGAGGATGDPRLSNLELKVASVEQLPQALQQIRNVLMSTHRGIEDFTFRTQEEWAEQIQIFVRNARLSGGLIAGIALLVGGIGIMNIMLASISERVREIGIRKSVGASTRDIFIQILAESVVIAVFGGVAGLIASFGLVQFLGHLSPTDNAPLVTPLSLVVAFSFSVMVGVLAGIVPAVKAARLNPIQALRYE
ncbi:MAG: Macrolide export ATP-binding/permease protein MacB [Verrucomicrobia bacterium ADurb.Bin118]|jgi:putative ABC transport system permease protein|nr:ABC transporter permease [Verrucomicrobiota bacterium]OQB94820.1 MAG: Macrolide export ATP-binding/permease protein MacB [Verrucomicrobia bacterium ADurb.Bin118]